MLQDPDGRAAGAYRTGGAPTAFLLDPNLRVRATLPLADGARVAAEVAELVAELVWDDRRPREITTQAPLLVVPDVLDPERCAELIAVWEQQGHSQTGVETATGGGRAEQHNAQLKRRRDHVVGDPQRSRELATTIGRRVMPELSKAFAYRASRFEGFKIACYQASDGGFFRAHRDNLSPTTAHRRFALTLNLNDGYQGGQLRFPEYGPERYRPAAGAGLVFSCSHLHEVLDGDRRAALRPVVVPVRGGGTPPGVRRRVPGDDGTWPSVGRSPGRETPASSTRVESVGEIVAAQLKGRPWVDAARRAGSMVATSSSMVAESYDASARSRSGLCEPVPPG